jgi:hypothetical protein
MKYAMLLIILLASYTLACPAEPELSHSLKKGLFDYLQNPTQSKLTFFEVKDLIATYLTVELGTADCSIMTGTESGLPISTILGKAGTVSQSVIPRCSDQTMYGECSSRKPKFCYSGMLKLMCNGPDDVPGTSDDCGCPEYSICETDGSCTPYLTACSDDSDCGTSGYVGTPYCRGINLFQDYINFTCIDAGQPTAYCEVDTKEREREKCPSDCQDGACI